MTLKQATLGLAISLLIMIAFAFVIRIILYQIGDAKALPVGGFTFTWRILADAVPMVLALTIGTILYFYLAIILILKRKTIDLPIFLLLCMVLFFATIIPTYQYAFQEGVKINLEEEVETWCYDNNKICVETCNYWNTLKINRALDENYIPNR